MLMTKNQIKLSGKEKEGEKVTIKAKVSRKFKVVGEEAEKNNHVDRVNDQKSKNAKFFFSKDFLDLRSAALKHNGLEMGQLQPVKIAGSKSTGKKAEFSRTENFSQKKLELSGKSASTAEKNYMQRSAKPRGTMKPNLGPAAAKAVSRLWFFSFFSILEKKEKMRSVGPGDHHPTVKKKGWWFWKNRGLGGGIVRVRVIACCMH